MDFNALLEKPEYQFFKSEPRLKNILLLGLGGSNAYGTNIKTSDIDIRGIVANNRKDILGLSSFEQFIDNRTDTTIYGLNKILGLLTQCNPNVIELLGLRQEDYFYIHSVGQELLDNKRMFLSQRCIATFGGYAYQQLSRLKNSIARFELGQSEKEEHILNSMQRVLSTFQEQHNTLDGSVKLYIDKSDTEDLETEIYMNAQFNHYPIRDYHAMLTALENVIRDYNKIGQRNNKKDELSLSKHMMHLIRLYMMAIDILESETIKTYRDKEHDLLMSIRLGNFMKDGRVTDDFWDILNEYNIKFDYAKIHTSLPKDPDMKAIEEFQMSVNERVVRNEL